MAAPYKQNPVDLPLTGKQKLFVKEYCVDLNGRQAAIRAGYSKKTADIIALQNLAKPHIQAEIGREQASLRNRIEANQERVIKEIARLALSNVTKVLDADGKVLPPSAWSEDLGPAISSLKTSYDKDGNPVHEVKLWDKNSALDKLSKHLGIYDDQVTVKVEDNRDFTDNDKARAIAALLSKGLIEGAAKPTEDT